MRPKARMPTSTTSRQIHPSRTETFSRRTRGIYPRASRRPDRKWPACGVPSTRSGYPRFGTTRLLGFDLLPRIKRINHVKLLPLRPRRGRDLAGLAPAMRGRAIRWDLVAGQYVQMIRYATAIRTGTDRQVDAQPLQPQQVVEHRKHRSRIADLLSRLDHGRRAREGIQQLVRDHRLEVSRMSISREPAQVR